MSVSDLRPGAPAPFRRGPRTLSVEELRARIGALVAERQALRDRRADPVVLERNRLELVGCQWELSYALIARHVAPRAARDAA